MKAFKVLSILAVAALLLVPATAMARPHFNISLNLFDCVRPCFVPVPAPVVVAPAPVVVHPRPVVIHPRPVVVAHPAPTYVFYPRHPKPRVEQRTIIKEYHYYHQAPEESDEDINSAQPYPYYP